MPTTITEAQERGWTKIFPTVGSTKGITESEAVDLAVMLEERIPEMLYKVLGNGAGYSVWVLANPEVCV